MKLLYFVFLIVLIFPSCTHRECAADKGYEIIGSYAKEKNKKDNWGLTGIGGNYGDYINKIFVTFVDCKELDVDQARILIVNAVEEFVFKINNDQSVKKFLATPQFLHENLELSLILSRPEGGFVEDNCIATASLLNGKLFYAVNRPERLETVYSEPYEEALQIVKSQQMSDRASTVKNEE